MSVCRGKNSCRCGAGISAVWSETAFGRLSPLDGNASYRNYIIDAVCNMTPQGLEEGAKYEMR